MKYILYLLLLNFASSAKSVEPEFDGAYIKTNSGKYIQINDIGSNKKEELAYRVSYRRPLKYCAVGTYTGFLKIKLNDFKGILVVGEAKNFELLSFHKIERLHKTPKNERYEMLFHKANKDIFCVVEDYDGGRVKINKKSSKGKMYIQPKKALSAGKYVAWLDKDFWLLEITE